MQALEGIKVLDFCRNAPGMFATTVLADLGADVLMIERPMDETRAAYEKLVAGIDGEGDERRHAAFNALQRNKRSLALNLKEIRGPEDISEASRNSGCGGGRIPARRHGSAGCGLRESALHQP